MAVALSAQDTVGAHTGSPASPVNYTGLTVASGDTDLVIWLSFGNSSGGAPTTISVVWDSGGTNQSMTAVTTLITSIDGTCTVAMFRLANPTSGNKTARVTWTTGGVINDLYVTGASFTGGGAISGATTNHSTTVSETISPTSGTTSMALSSFACNQVAYSAPATTGTSICVNASGGTSQLDAIRRVGLGGATAMVPGAAGTGHDWVAMGVSIDPGFSSSTGSASGSGTAAAVGRMVSFIQPDADSIDGGWTNESGGTTLYTSIDEHLIPNDADYIISSNNPSNDLCRVSLSDPSAGVAQPFNISYRYGKIGPSRIDITVTLKQGSTIIASWTHTDVPA